MKCQKCGAEYEGAFCPNCQNQVNTQYGEPRPIPVKPKKPLYKKWWFWLIIVVVVIGIGSGAGNAGNSETTDAKSEVAVSTTKKEITYEKVELRTMVDTLKSNALKAEKTYQDKYVEVTGKISNFDSDGSYISIKPVNADAYDFTTITCNIQNDEQRNYLLEKSVGDNVTIKGKVTSVGEVLGYSIKIDEVK